MPAHSPVIGICGVSTESKSVQAMRVRVREANATPLILANHAARSPRDDLGKCDAVIIMGNDFDINPNEYISRYPEGDPRRAIHPQTRSAASTPESAARAVYERQLIEHAINTKMPLFGICGGMQQINVWCGGTLHQHIPDLIGHDDYSYNAGMAAVNPVTSVTIVPDSLLARVAAEGSLYTPSIPPLVPTSGTINSFHHQAVDIVGNDLVASAFSDHYKRHDGSGARLVEAIERAPDGKYKDQFVLGVQWHPEFLPDNATTARLLEDLRREAAQFAQAHGRTHPPHQAEHETVLSALPFIRQLSESSSKSSDTALPPSQTPSGKSPSTSKSR